MSHVSLKTFAAAFFNYTRSRSGVATVFHHQHNRTQVNASTYLLRQLCIHHKVVHVFLSSRQFQFPCQHGHNQSRASRPLVTGNRQNTLVNSILNGYKSLLGLCPNIRTTYRQSKSHTNAPATVRVGYQVTVANSEERHSC